MATAGPDPRPARAAMFLLEVILAVAMASALYLAADGCIRQQRRLLRHAEAKIAARAVAAGIAREVLADPSLLEVYARVEAIERPGFEATVQVGGVVPSPPGHRRLTEVWVRVRQALPARGRVEDAVRIVVHD